MVVNNTAYKKTCDLSRD